MIALHSDCLMFQLASGESVPCSAEMITVEIVGEAHGVSVARVALAWLLSKPHVMSIIIGAKTVEQLDDNLAAAELELTPEDIAK